MATMAEVAGMRTIRFEAPLYTIDRSTIVRLTEDASKKLPSSLARAGCSTRLGSGSESCTPEHPADVGGNNAHGALGMGSMGQRDQKP